MRYPNVRMTRSDRPASHGWELVIVAAVWWLIEVVLPLWEHTQ